jgi:putative addiction module component (TIGR02574 family)
MKRVDLPVSRLSLAQKLDLMETLWADLSRDDTKLESPAWHKTVLEDREKAFKSGKVPASDWGQAKKRIRKRAL